VQPVRTEGGQRLYTDADVARLRLLREVTEAGRSISWVADLSDAELRSLSEEDEAGAEEAGSGVPDEERARSEAGAFRVACLAAAERMDGDGVYATLMRAVVSLRPSEFLDDVLAPVLHEVGERWHAGRLGPSHEHVVSGAARRVLGWLLDAYETAPGAPLLVATTASGEQHEFGAMMVSALALEEGWRVEYMGASLPPEEIVLAAEVLKASAIALSVVNRDDVAGVDVVSDARSLVEGLPTGFLVLVGGAGAEHRRAPLESAGARVFADLDGARALLRRERGQRTASS
jgi:methanogenic corrinoid protein MtbC1